MTRSNYGASLNVITGADSSIVNLAATANGLRNQSSIDSTIAVISAFPNMNFHGVDLERLSSTGINLELTVGTT
jgi:hypothetical protein